MDMGSSILDQKKHFKNHFYHLCGPIYTHKFHLHISDVLFVSIYFLLNVYQRMHHYHITFQSRQFSVKLRCSATH